MNPIPFMPAAAALRLALLLSFSSDHAFAAEPER